MSKLNVGQLIDLLSGFPADLPVVVDGYEGGATEYVGVSLTMVIPNHYGGESWMFGEHGTDPLPGDPTMECVQISRLDRPGRRGEPR